MIVLIVYGLRNHNSLKYDWLIILKHSLSELSCSHELTGISVGRFRPVGSRNHRNRLHNNVIIYKLFYETKFLTTEGKTVTNTLSVSFVTNRPALRPTHKHKHIAAGPREEKTAENDDAPGVYEASAPRRAAGAAQAMQPSPRASPTTGASHLPPRHLDALMRVVSTAKTCACLCAHHWSNARVMLRCSSPELTMALVDAWMLLATGRDAQPLWREWTDAARAAEPGARQEPHAVGAHALCLYVLKSDLCFDDVVYGECV